MSKARRTLLLWLVLLILYGLFYLTFSNRAGAPVEPPRPECETSTSQLLLQWAVPVGLFVTVLVLFRWWSRRYHRMNEGVALLNQGRVLQALESFEKSRGNDSKDPAHTFNIAVAQLRLWRLEQARRGFEAARQMKGTGQGNVAVLAPENEALVAALQGRLGDAEEALQRTTDQSTPSQVALARGLIAARRGDWELTRKQLNSHEARQLGGVLGALMRTVDAYAVERLGGGLRPVDRVALFAEAGPEGLKNAWPELIAFVEAAPVW